ncbi:NAD(P)-dependent oxidoreductase [Empedobacter tilapiae]|uniref:NAD-dependent epimerase/dehydratase family protein n=1 Tax=Empedobacter tilapiae TaxID=2491114 RepID=A0A4Z1BNQ3_9FLAO|nr:NAD(P)H-binding protein [Empedobacter tilapiae]TGN23715.1 NAD-dependent epimerase/dehydratase family protein [Empedobacter tilapiae]
MRVAVIGATGFVGSHIVEELVNRNQSIKAFARNTDKVLDSKNVAKVALDVNDVQALATDLKGADVVVSAFNAGWTNPNIYEDYMKGAKAIEEATKLAGVKRLIVIGGAGSLYVNDQKELQIVDAPGFPEEIKQGALAARDYYNVLKQNNDLEWTVFSPAPEMHQGTSGERKGTYRLGNDVPVFNAEGRSILSVEDVAVVIADEIENAKHINKRFTAAY